MPGSLGSWKRRSSKEKERQRNARGPYRPNKSCSNIEGGLFPLPSVMKQYSSRPRSHYSYNEIHTQSRPTKPLSSYFLNNTCSLLKNLELGILRVDTQEVHAFIASRYPLSHASHLSCAFPRLVLPFPKDGYSNLVTPAAFEPPLPCH